MKRHHSVNFYIVIISFLLFAVVVNAQEGSSEPMGNDPRIYDDLRTAILQGNLKAVRELLDKGANVNAMIDDETVLANAALRARVPMSYDPGLPQAVLREREEIVRLLLDRGADVNLPSVNGRITALDRALDAGNVALVKLLLDRGARAADLSKAVWTGRTEIVKLLIEHGARVNAKDDESFTPLIIAIKNENNGIARLLIDNGADVHMKDHLGNTPLFYAREHRYDSLPLIALLTGRGAHESLWDNSAFRGSVRVGVFLMILAGVIMLLIREDRNLGPYRPRENAALHFDRKDWRPSTIRVIKGDRWATNVLYFIILTLPILGFSVFYSGREVGYFWKYFCMETPYSAYFIAASLVASILLAIVLLRTHRVRSLFKRGVEVPCTWVEDVATGTEPVSVPDTRVYEYSYGGRTYRFSANIMADRLWTFPGDGIALVDPDHPGRATLRDNYAKTFKKDKSTRPVQGSQIENDEKASDDQEGDEIDFNLLYSQPSTANLVQAVTAGNLEKVKTFVSSGAAVNDGGPFGNTPLMWAAGRGHEDIVKYLVEKKSDVNRANSTGMTALMFAAKGGHRDIVEFLLAHGADHKAKDKSGLTALAMARKKGNFGVIEILRNADRT